MKIWRKVLRVVVRKSPQLAVSLARWPRAGREERQLAIWKFLVSAKGPGGIDGLVEIVGRHQLDRDINANKGAVLVLASTGPRSATAALVTSLAAEPLLVANVGDRLARHFDVSIVVPGHASRTRARALKRAVDHARKGGVVVFGLEEGTVNEPAAVPRGFAAVARISDVAVFGVVTQFQSGVLPTRVSVTPSHSICKWPGDPAQAEERLVAGVLASIKELG